MANYSADVIIAGAGLAGLATAYDLLEHGRYKTYKWYVESRSPRGLC
jgi:uncharacterized protein with NAD-binding domain and iron-sulfur cluster